MQAAVADEIHRRLTTVLPWRVVGVNEALDYVPDRPLEEIAAT